mmetsp:Transcript_2464/g.6580  ORF Transcript_2464/g.6580 Transcript_2464/m.6580 type:complete len:455 (-) Transcript_2464:175-1539(-)
MAEPQANPKSKVVVTETPMAHQRRVSLIQQEKTHLIFERFDEDNDGHLNRTELSKAIAEITGKDDITMAHVETLLDEFDRDRNGLLDFCEFRMLEKYVKRNSRSTKRRSSAISICLHELAMLMEEGDEDFDDSLTCGDSEQDFAQRSNEDSYLTKQDSTNTRFTRRSSMGTVFSMTALVNKVVGKAQRDTYQILNGCANKLYPFKDILCVQDNLSASIDYNKSYQVDFDTIFDEDELSRDETHDPDFESKFAPSAMRCLALVSHNEMKKTMRQFVLANRNLLKKFRLTGTNSTMTMLKEVFKDEPPGTVAFGPACASGPLGGDAELVAHMVTGKIGGIFFFQDPMNAHPHRVDIDCLVRQALVHNTMMAETPTSALMLVECLRTALRVGRPELIPSFFFSLQSPTVEAYKAQQKAVVDSQKKEARASMMVMQQPLQVRPSIISTSTVPPAINEH